MGKGVVDHFQDFSSLLSQITAYRDKTSDYIWSFTSLNCIQSSDQYHVELRNLSKTKSQAFPDIETIGLINTTDLVILNSYILTKLRKKVNLKTDPNHKKSTPGKTKRHGEQIAGLTGILNNPFHGLPQNMEACAKIPGNIINGLLPIRKYGMERVEQFIKKKLLLWEKNFFLQYYRNFIEKKRKVISVLKEDHQALFSFVEKYPEKKEVFKYLFKNFPLAFSILGGKLYQP